jgi:hypothetical protein
MAIMVEEHFEEVNDTEEDVDAADHASYGPDADKVDPIRMGRAKLRKMGFEPMSPLRALRRHCVQCCGGSNKEVALCCSSDCSAWPFRLGRNPWVDARKLSDEQRQAAAVRLAAARAAKAAE